MEWDSGVHAGAWRNIEVWWVYQRPSTWPVNRSPARMLPVKTGSKEYIAIQSLEVLVRHSIQRWQLFA